MMKQSSELLFVRRQCSVRRRTVRSLSRQSRVRAGQLARLFRRVAERAGLRWHEPQRRGPWPDRRIVCPAREGQCLRRRRATPGDRSQAGLRPVADRRVPLPRLAVGQSRSAQAPRTSAYPRARTRVLRLHRSRHGPDVPCPEPVFRLRAGVLARDRQGAARHVLRHDRRRVHVHQRSGAKALVEGKARVDPLDAEFLDRKEEAHPESPDGRRRPRALPAHQVRRPEALLAGRRRKLHRARWTKSCSTPARTACRRSSSAWPTAAA